jgi:hypothetical protein
MGVGGVESGDVVLYVSCQMCVNKILEFVRQRGEIVVDVRCGVHGVKRGGVKSVREEDRHHRQVLVTDTTDKYS